MLVIIWPIVHHVSEPGIPSFNNAELNFRSSRQLHRALLHARSSLNSYDPVPANTSDFPLGAIVRRSANYHLSAHRMRKKLRLVSKGLRLTCDLDHMLYDFGCRRSVDGLLRLIPMRQRIPSLGRRCRASPACSSLIAAQVARFLRLCYPDSSPDKLRRPSLENG